MRMGNDRVTKAMVLGWWEGSGRECENEGEKEEDSVILEEGYERCRYGLDSGGTNDE